MVRARRLLLVAAALAIVAGLSFATPLWLHTRATGEWLLTPVLEQAASLRWWLSSRWNAGTLARENDSLREQLAQYEARAATTTSSENAELRTLAGVPTPRGFHAVGATIIGQRSDETGARYLINRGHRDGLAPGQPVVVGFTQTPGGAPSALLLGVVVDASETIATFATTTSPLTQVPAEVVTEPRVTGLAVGEFNLAVRLQFLPTEAAVPPGALVVTGNLSERIPPGLPIGRVSSRELAAGNFFASAIIAPPVPPERFRFVQVLLQN